jgi:hypothetical protein
MPDKKSQNSIATTWIRGKQFTIALSPRENAHVPENPLLQNAHRPENLLLQLKSPRFVGYN